jgi:argininosuccinate synthase
MPTPATDSGVTPIVLAYSGGLDTSFLVPWIAAAEQRPVITVTVDTGGIDAAAPSARAPSERSLTTRWTRARTTSSRCCAS